MKQQNNDGQKELNEGLQLLKTLLIADIEQENNIYQAISKKINSLINNKQQLSIIQELQQANIDSALKEMRDNTIIGINAVYFSSVLLTQFMFTRKTTKVIFLLSCAYFNFYIMQPIQMEYKLRKLAQLNTLTGQEIRNLYRFYFKDQPFTKQMEDQCKVYLQAENIKKNIYSRRI